MNTSVIARHSVTVSSADAHRYSPGGLPLFGKAPLTVLLTLTAGVAALGYTIGSGQAPVRVESAPGVPVIADTNAEIALFAEAKNNLGPQGLDPQWQAGPYWLYADGSVLVRPRDIRESACEVYDNVDQFVTVRLGGVVNPDSAEADLVRAAKVLRGEPVEA